MPLFCENETNLARLYGAAPTTPYPKDGIGEHVISGAATVNPDQRGTKCAFWYRLSIAPGETAESQCGTEPSDAGLADPEDVHGEDHEEYGQRAAYQGLREGQPE